MTKLDQRGRATGSRPHSSKGQGAVWFWPGSPRVTIQGHPWGLGIPTAKPPPQCSCWDGEDVCQWGPFVLPWLCDSG